ncbi:MAG: Rrf2 family transcriptional regulator [bacterium]
MNVSTKGRYALRALTHLAISYDKKNNAPVSIKNISLKEEISNRYLENIFVSMRKANLVKSLKGEKGGFMLAVSPEKITVFDILQAVEKGTAPTKCAADFDFCGNAPKCGIRKVWVKLDKLVSTYLKNTTLSEVTGTHTFMNKNEN